MLKICLKCNNGELQGAEQGGEQLSSGSVEGIFTVMGESWSRFHWTLCPTCSSFSCQEEGEEDPGDHLFAPARPDPARRNPTTLDPARRNSTTLDPARRNPTTLGGIQLLLILLPGEGEVDQNISDQNN